MAELLLLLVLYWIVNLFSGKKAKSNSMRKNRNSEDDDLFFTDLGNGMGF